jgi:hypothetical protein
MAGLGCAICAMAGLTGIGGPAWAADAVFPVKFGTVAWRVTLPAGFRKVDNGGGRVDFIGEAVQLSLSAPVPSDPEELASNLRQSHRLACTRSGGAFTSDMAGSGQGTRLSVACVTGPSAEASEIGFLAQQGTVSLLAASLKQAVAEPGQVRMMAETAKGILDNNPVKPSR